jgi:hypothetical protein
MLLNEDWECPEDTGAQVEHRKVNVEDALVLTVSMFFPPQGKGLCHVGNFEQCNDNLHLSLFKSLQEFPISFSKIMDLSVWPKRLRM